MKIWNKNRDRDRNGEAKIERVKENRTKNFGLPSHVVCVNTYRRYTLYAMLVLQLTG